RGVYQERGAPGEGCTRRGVHQERGAPGEDNVKIVSKTSAILSCLFENTWPQPGRAVGNLGGGAQPRRHHPALEARPSLGGTTQPVLSGTAQPEFK
ncbi:hypothetical protein P7K49_037641, partial [Saguinus oedipus]